MKSFVQQIINEARIQRTIDSKIWASMSSASSKNRANGAVDVKPMRRDDANVLLLKYVAGLLTIKAECPATVTDIEKIGSYKLIGQAAIDAGVSLSQILKLYVENGGTFNGDIKDNTEIASNTEYPAYDEIDNSDDTETEETAPSTTFDDSIAARINANEPDDNPDDESDQTEEINKQDTKDYPSYDEVDIENKETFADKYADKISIASYFKTVKRLLQRAKEGDNLCWGDKGLTLENNGNIIAKCVGTTYMFIDKNPRFLLKVSDLEVALGTAGNNKVYDDYYYKQGTTGLDNRISVKPGSNYYFQEEIKGKFYTNILADNGNEAAEETKIISNINIKAGVDSELSLEIAKNINERSYLPTLPELVKCIKHLAPGKYWTSSVANNGKANIILQVKPDRIIKTDNPLDTAKVATFIAF